MTIEEKIAAVAKEYFPQYPYIFDNLYRIDERINAAELPCIFCTLPSGGTITIRNGKYEDTETLMLGFFDVVPHDANGEDNAAVYNNMKALGMEFIARLNDNRIFGYVDTLTYEVWCFRMADIVTGVTFTLRIQDERRCMP